MTERFGHFSLRYQRSASACTSQASRPPVQVGHAARGAADQPSRTRPTLNRLRRKSAPRRLRQRPPRDLPPRRRHAPAAGRGAPAPQAYARRDRARGCRLRRVVRLPLSDGRPFLVTTDDAYVQAYNTTLAAKVAGYVASVPVDRQCLRPCRRRDRHHRRRRLPAGGRFGARQSRNPGSDRRAHGHQITAQEAAVEQTRTQLASAQAAAQRMELELNRQNALVAHAWSSRHCRTGPGQPRPGDRRRARRESRRSTSANANVDVLKGQKQEAVSALSRAQDRAGQGRARLSFTVIRAPIDGVVGNRAVQTGDYVQTGQRLASLCRSRTSTSPPTSRRPRSRALRPGQAVSIAVDALPEHAVERCGKLFAGLGGRVLAAAA